MTDPHNDKKDDKKDDNNNGGLSSIFSNPAYRYAMGVMGIGWALVGGAIYLAVTQEKDVPPAPAKPTVENVAPQTPRP